MGRGRWRLADSSTATVRGRDPDPVVYLPYRSQPLGNRVAIMVRGEAVIRPRWPRRSASELRRLDPNLPLYRVMTLQRAIEEAGWNGRMANALAQNIGAIALLMALVGLYAVTAHAVYWWRPEIGFRMLLDRRRVMSPGSCCDGRSCNSPSGSVSGLAACTPSTGSFTPADDPIRLMDARVLVPLMAAIAMVAFAACVMPMRRAMRVDPVVALRTRSSGRRTVGIE